MVIRNDDYRDYLKWQSEEKMDSTAQGAIVDDALKRIPINIESVLCVGVGDGYEADAFVKSGIPKKVKSITLNLDAIKYKIDVELGDMHAIPFAERSFDLVFAKDVFEHSFSHWLALKEMRRVAKKYIMIILPDPEHWSEGKYHTIVPYPDQMLALAKKFELTVHQQWTFEAQGHHPNFGYLFAV